MVCYLVLAAALLVRTTCGRQPQVVGRYACRAYETKSVAPSKQHRLLSLTGGAQNDYYYYQQDDGDEVDDEDWGEEDDAEYGYQPEPRAAAPSFSPMDFLAGGGGQNRKLGFMLSGGGCLVTLLGITLFFNGLLLKIGNLLFVSGMPLILGPGRTVSYFAHPTRYKTRLVVLKTGL